MTTLDTETLMTLAGDFPGTSREDWMAAVGKASGGASFEKTLTRRTYEGLHLQPVYTAEDAPAGRAAPVTGGAPGMARTANGWDLRQMHAHGDPSETAKAVRQDLERGVTSILLRLDRPGIDGVVIGSVDDLDRALEGMHLEMAPVVLDAGVHAPVAARMLRDLWSRRGHGADQVAGGFGIDPLAALAREGWLADSTGDALAGMAGIARETARELPKVRAVSVNSAPCYEAGANEVQDLAISMATAIAYLRAMEAAGMDVAAAAGQIEFSYALGIDVFQGIAKLRAARRLWARILEASGADPATQPMQQHAITAERAIAGRDIRVNMLRATISTFAAGVGGADSLTVLPHDHALGLPDSFARRIARNTQIILMEESGLHHVADPAGGSWYVERLTEDFAARAWELMQGIERDGGMVAALLSGRIAEMLAASRAERAQNIATRKDELTGVSTFPDLEEERPHGLAVDRAALRAGCPAGIWPEQAGAAIRIEPLHPHRLGEGFEALRDAGDAFLERTGQRPSLFQANLGTPADFTARATFTQNFFAAGGIATLPAGIDAGRAEAEIGDAFTASGCRYAVLCSSDSIYAETAAIAAGSLKQAGAERIFLAGRPGDNEAAWRAAGIDGFIFAGDRTLETLQDVSAGLVAPTPGVTTS